MPWLTVCCLLVLQAEPSRPPESLPRVADPELRHAIELVEEGDYPGGLRAIDGSLRRLRAVPGRNHDRAIGHLYAGVALVAQGKTSIARGRFREALAENPRLTLSAVEFPPKVIELLRLARADAGAATTVSSRPRLIQSASGSSGAMRSSRFELEEARSIFHVPADRRAVVSFEWEAAPGNYRLLGAWRDPQGHSVLQPEVVLENRGPRMTAYWILELTPSIAAGQWTLEVTEGGRSVGQHAIQVLNPARAAEAESDDLYARVWLSLVTIEKRGADGLTFGQGMGFLVSDTRVATAFQVVDGARSLLLRLSDGRSLVCDRLAAWSRWQDWALVDVTATGLPGLEAAQGPVSKAQRYRVLDLDSDDKPYLARPVVALPTTMGKAGERLTLGLAGSVADAGFRLLLSRGAVGGPVLDARGRVAGIVGGSVVPGEATADSRLGSSSTMATPMSLLSKSVASPATLEQLIANGESLEPVQRGDLTRAGLYRGEPATGSSPDDETTEFSRSDSRLLIWARLDPSRRVKVSLRARIYDLDGALKAETDAVRRELTPGRFQIVSWPLDIAKFPSGAYRTDILLDAHCVWRGYFRLGE